VVNVLDLIELKIDIDDEQNPCWAGVRLLKIKHFAELIGAVGVFTYKSPRGFHVKILMPYVPRDVQLKLRAMLNDDYKRWDLDEERLFRKSIPFDIMFMWRRKTYGEVKTRSGGEVPVPIERVLDFLQLQCAQSFR
jgi:hypothetical protein